MNVISSLDSLMPIKVRTPRLRPIIIVQGGQWGSEAKGLITAKLTKDRKVDIAIRTGTVNAGHTVYYKGRAYAMQQLPVAWVRPGCALVLGPGAYIHPEILRREIDWVNEAMPEANVLDRLFIDRNCGIHLDEHTQRSSRSGRHVRMGATGKGSSEAVVDKIYGRGEEGTADRPYLFRDYPMPAEWDGCITDTVALVNRQFDLGHQILIEGTQGTLLDLHLGDYPYTTHKQTQAASWMAEAGLSPTLPVDLVSVMRTFPIRVAGNSGPLPQEISWYQLAGWINQKLVLAGRPRLIDPGVLAVWDANVRSRCGTMGDPAFWSAQMKKEFDGVASTCHKDVWTGLLPEHQVELKKLFEMTTVTKKLRRIAKWDWESARRSVMLNRPSSVALTFLNYEFPEAWGVTRTTFGELPASTRVAILHYVQRVRKELGVSVSYVGFGPAEESTFRLYDDEEGGAQNAG